MQLFHRINSKLELFRLEQRYTRHRSKRTTFVSDATYVDGEYVYASTNTSPSTTGSSNASSRNQGGYNTDGMNDGPAKSYQYRREVDVEPYQAQNRHKRRPAVQRKRSSVMFGSSRRDVEKELPNEPTLEPRERDFASQWNDNSAREEEEREEKEREQKLSRRISKSWGSVSGKEKRDAKRRSMAVVQNVNWRDGGDNRVNGRY